MYSIEVHFDAWNETQTFPLKRQAYNGNDPLTAPKFLRRTVPKFPLVKQAHVTEHNNYAPRLLGTRKSSRLLLFRRSFMSMC